MEIGSSYDVAVDLICGWKDSGEFIHPGNGSVELALGTVIEKIVVRVRLGLGGYGTRVLWLVAGRL